MTGETLAYRSVSFVTSEANRKTASRAVMAARPADRKVAALPESRCLGARETTAWARRPQRQSLSCRMASIKGAKTSILRAFGYFERDPPMRMTGDEIGTAINYRLGA